MKKETEILTESVEIISNARSELLSNRTLWDCLYHAERYLHEQYKAEFDKAFKEKDILEAAEIA